VKYVAFSIFFIRILLFNIVSTNRTHFLQILHVTVKEEISLSRVNRQFL